MENIDIIIFNDQNLIADASSMIIKTKILSGGCKFKENRCSKSGLMKNINHVAPKEISLKKSYYRERNVDLISAPLNIKSPL